MNKENEIKPEEQTQRASSEQPIGNPDKMARNGSCHVRDLKHYKSAFCDGAQCTFLLISSLYYKALSKSYSALALNNC